MSDRILDIDHVMVNVPDADRAGAAFEALGFVATPTSVMPGLANRLVCFGAPDAGAGVCNYIELMALTDAGVAPPPMPGLLSRPFGPVSTVMAVDDADAVAGRLAGQGNLVPGKMGQGMAIGPVLHLQRDWHLPGGEVISPAFAVGIPEPDQTPFYWNFCQHKTPEHYVRGDFTGHGNGVDALLAVLAVHPDPLAATRASCAAWGVAVTGEDPVVAAPGRVSLEVFTPDGFADRFGGPVPEPGLHGLRLRSTDLAVTAATMPGAQARAGGLVIRPEAVGSTVLHIVPAVGTG